MKKLAVACILALAVLLCSSGAFAQSAGSVRGTITDPQGNTVPGAKVTLVNVASNTAQETTTNDSGLFVFAYVNAAKYDVTVQKDGFRKSTASITVEVAQTLNVNFSLELGNVSETVTVTESNIVINTSNGELAHEISGKELHTLPLLNNGYYDLVGLTPGSADTGKVSGDMRGLGLAVGGARTSSVNFQLDGAENNDTFVAGVAQYVPLDSVQEFKVQTNGATAEFGRNPIVTNVVTKSGTNTLHASAYEIYRGASLSTTPFDDKASGNPKSNFVRNQFGGSAGGRVIKDRLFFFGSMEGDRVRSSATDRFYVPTQAFVDNSAPEVVSYMNGYGLPTSNCADSPVTAQYVVENIEGGNYATDPLLNSTTGNPIPASTQLFCRTALRAPIDAGGGTPGDTWLATGRVDYQYSQKTSVYFRYAYSDTKNPVGAGSTSPYSVFNTPATARNQNIVGSIIHSFSNTLIGELRASFNRVHPELPLGKAPGTAPCWQYNRFNIGLTPTGDDITFPGYLPNACLGSGLDVGGPQNVYQEAGSLTWLKGRHTFKFGGAYFHMRHNHTFGAYENGYYESPTMQDMLDGQINLFAQAFDPRGHVPGDKYDLTTDGPFKAPSFTRHYHYNELSGFGEDTVKLSNKLTASLGLRWEYFGVQHSPENEKYLDANLYLNAVGSVPPLTANKSIFEQVRDARFRRTNQFYRPSYGNFGPRVGLAYDLFGNGRTVFRAGYGYFYDRNFGNATFNAIQNPPNYAVFTGTAVDFFGGTLTIDPNEYNILAGAGGSFTVSSSARMLNNDLKTASNQQWNATLEHNVFGKGIIVGLSYMGSRGDHLYSLNNLNQRGSCLLLLSVGSGPCSAAGPGGGSYRINRSGLTGMNRRGNEGLSRYHALAVDVRSQELGHTGLMVFGTYTWSHSIDNESSFFGDSSFEGNFGFGFRDAYKPGADRSNSSNDIRNRGTLSFVWDLPVAKGQKGVSGQILGGWTLTSIFVAQTGGAFSVYDGSGSSQCNDSGTNFCEPVFLGGTVPKSTAVATGAPNTFQLYTLSGAQYVTHEDYCTTHALSTPLGPFGGGGVGVSDPGSTDNYGCTAALINLYATSLEAPRNQFRTPGLWNYDAAIGKSFRMPWERHRLALRADFINLFNHANLYADPVTNIFSSGAVTGGVLGPGSGSILAHKGTPNSGGKERRDIQLSLRYEF